jgi:DNA-binding CsgD family transcriptional regulator
MSSAPLPPKSLPHEIAQVTPPSDLRARIVRLGSHPYVLLSFKRKDAERTFGLTPAERRVALALLEGLSNAEIACLRGSSPRTVANQIASLYRKVGVRSRAELASRWASALSPAGE